jgi:serine/threonine protein kinase
MPTTDPRQDEVVENVLEEVASTLPARVGRYEVRREIGRGGMGVVYEAVDPALGRPVALKMIEVAHGAAAEDRALFEERFFREARIAAGLSHPGILTVHDVGRDDETGQLFMALEFLKGRTLAEVLVHDGPLPWREAMRVVARLAEALHYAHSKGVVHRDVKPANVMLLPGGAPKLLDFGIAQAGTGRPWLTAGGHSFGTPLYMPPEQARGESVDGRGDLFSLGAVAYTLLSGRLAFVGRNLADIVHRVLYSQPLPPSEVVPGVPVTVDRVIARALAKSKDERYANGAQMAAAIEELLAAGDPGTEHALETLIPDVVPKIAPTPTLPFAPQATLTTPREPWQAGRSGKRLSWGRAALLVVAVVAAVGARPGRPEQGANEPLASVSPSAGPSPSAPSSPSPTPPQPAAAPTARLQVNLEHPLKDGTLRIWLDGAPLLSAELRGKNSRNMVGLKLSKGELARVLDVPAGRHAVRVRMVWDDGEKTETTFGTFEPGSTRRLEIRLGRLFKNLSLDWS